mmetsp:Transcript_14962/g.30228  ORF Transcript_14962/g.30228 Transcript_14962/m.30228 type:complete len:163 (+) Transcript_14962:1165-1653(+)
MISVLPSCLTELSEPYKHRWKVRRSLSFSHFPLSTLLPPSLPPAMDRRLTTSRQTGVLRRALCLLLSFFIPVLFSFFFQLRQTRRADPVQQQEGHKTEEKVQISPPSTKQPTNGPTKDVQRYIHTHSITHSLTLTHRIDKRRVTHSPSPFRSFSLLCLYEKA